jgi:hypothetical protein
MNPKLKTLFFFLIGAFAGILTMYLISNYKIEKRNQYAQETTHIDNYNESGKKILIRLKNLKKNIKISPTIIR